MIVFMEYCSKFTVRKMIISKNEVVDSKLGNEKQIGIMIKSMAFTS